MEEVKDRMRRVTETLHAAEISYAVIGGNPMQHWVTPMDESAVRNTQDVDMVWSLRELFRALG